MIDNAALCVRPPRPADVAALTALCGQLGYPTTVAALADRLQRAMADPLRQTLVAELGGAVVGCIETHMREFLVDEGDAEITGFVVDEQARSAGIGARLLAAAEQWAAGRGARTIRVRCNAKRLAAHRFYEKNGYEELKRQVFFRREIRPTAG